MSNVHQLVTELASYEQEVRDLEEQLAKAEDAYNDIVGDNETYIEAMHLHNIEVLETQLDMVYKKIDELETLIEEESEQSHGHYGDDY